MGIRIQHIGTAPSKLLSLLLVFVVLCSGVTFSQEFEEIVDLRGLWRFSIGDNPGWAKPDFDDSGWEKITVPGSWEGQGFHGYDGYGWYRKSVYLPQDLQQVSYYLKLGYIDDVDEVYVNGIKIGSTGSFPPNYTTAHRSRRLYMIPQKVNVAGGKISIAIRVFDEGGEGGILNGDISIVADRSSITAGFDLQGAWSFKTGKCSNLPDKQEYKNWDKIMVPGTWEEQGYKAYDGLACYVSEFELKGQYTDKRMVLLLGRIDDLDRVFLNGTLIGQSGIFARETVNLRSDMYKQSRGYYIPPGILLDEGTNVLVVQVLDAHGSGGIWDGTVGLITQDDYIRFWRNKRRSVK